MGALQQALVMASSGVAVDDLSDIAMVARYETWRETVVSDGTAQAQATDWSGNSNHAVQANGTLKPLYKTNRIASTLPAWRFNGSGQLFQTGSLPAMNNIASRWYYVVVSFVSTPNSVNGPFSLVNTGAANVEAMYYTPGGNQVHRIYSYGSTGQDDIGTGISPGTGVFRLYSIVLDGTNVATKIGAGAYSGSAAQNTPAPNGTASFILGDLISTAVGNGAPCEIAAAFVGNTVLTTTQKSRIEAYMLRVFGVAA